MSSFQNKSSFKERIMPKSAQKNFKIATSADQEFAGPIFLVVKEAYDSKTNPYFNFDGNHFDMLRLSFIC